MHIENRIAEARYRLFLSHTEINALLERLTGYKVTVLVSHPHVAKVALLEGGPSKVGFGTVRYNLPTAWN